MIKFWDMDNTSLLTIVDAEGGLAVWFDIVAYTFFYLTYMHSSKKSFQVNLALIFGPFSEYSSSPLQQGGKIIGSFNQ